MMNTSTYNEAQHENNPCQIAKLDDYANKDVRSGSPPRIIANTRISEILVSKTPTKKAIKASMAHDAAGLEILPKFLNI